MWDIIKLDGKGDREPLWGLGGREKNMVEICCIKLFNEKISKPNGNKGDNSVQQSPLY